MRETDFGSPIRTEHLPTRIATQYAKRIYDGEFAAGDKLPTENAMSKSFGVSRSVVREAIAQLRNEGLVETRQGLGAFVIERQARQIRLADASRMDRKAFRDLYQLRFPLEVEAAALAAEFRSEAQMEKLDHLLDLMSGSTDWGQSGVTADLDFHRVIAEATGNEYFPQFIGAISDRISHVITTARSRGQLEQVIAVTIEEHSAIRDAIRNKDVEAARAAMYRHLVASASRVGISIK